MFVQMEQLFGRSSLNVKDPATGQCYSLRELPREEDEEVENELVAAVMEDVRERSVRTQ